MTIKARVHPAAEQLWITGLGIDTGNACEHLRDYLDGKSAPVIPGLDGNFCIRCRVWWIDQFTRDALLGSKRKV